MFNIAQTLLLYLSLFALLLFLICFFASYAWIAAKLGIKQAAHKKAQEETPLELFKIDLYFFNIKISGK